MTDADKERSPGARLRASWSQGAVAIPGAFNALTAKMIERLGFSAAYFSGGALSAGWAGVPDIGLLTMSEFAEQIAVIARATRLPLLCDADTGFGEAINAARTVELYEAAGAAGLHLEDQILPKRCGHLSGKALIEPEAMAAKVRAAAKSRRDPDFVVVARTDARSVEGIERAIDRAKRYLDAGADAIFPEALESRDEFERFAREVSAPLIANMTEFGKSQLLSVRELDALGYRGVLFPLTPFRAAMQAAEAMLVELRDAGTQANALDRLQTRSRLYDLIGYEEWEERDRRFFG